MFFTSEFTIIVPECFSMFGSILFSILFISSEYSASLMSSSLVSSTSSVNSDISFSKVLRDDINFSIEEASIETF